MSMEGNRQSVQRCSHSTGFPPRSVALFIVALIRLYNRLGSRPRAHRSSEDQHPQRRVNIAGSMSAKLIGSLIDIEALGVTGPHGHYGLSGP